MFFNDDLIWKISLFLSGRTYFGYYIGKQDFFKIIYKYYDIDKNKQLKEIIKKHKNKIVDLYYFILKYIYKDDKIKFNKILLELNIERDIINNLDVKYYYIIIDGNVEKKYLGKFKKKSMFNSLKEIIYIFLVSFLFVIIIINLLKIYTYNFNL